MKSIKAYAISLIVLLISIIGLGLPSPRVATCANIENDESYEDRSSMRSSADLNIHLNDYNLAHQFGTVEKIQYATTQTQKVEKLIRSSVFDCNRTLILSKELKWLVPSPYRHSLSPIWQPSIPIAHRKLVI